LNHPSKTQGMENGNNTGSVYMRNTHSLHMTKSL
jgi:hypothetical protein